MLKVYLADLVYDTVRTNYAVPLNIAYIAAYVKERYTHDVDIKIFKFPQMLEESIKNAPPDIMGFSNYSWNERLNHVFIKMAKRINPNVLTVMGGPNIRTDYDGIGLYLSTHKLLDYYILFEGEVSFGNLVRKVLGGSGLLKHPPGCAGLHEGQYRYEPLDLKEIPVEINLPSPYLTGFLDPYLSDPNMIPLFETNRGCPFGCVYCTWGIAALSRVRRRSLNVVYEELDYVAQKSSKQVNWIFCDANFGMLERDVEIAKKIRQIMDEKGFPIHVTLWHSKNSSKRNIEIAKIIKDSEGYIAIQSTDPEVLKKCGRGSIKLSHLKTQIDYYRNNRLEVLTDILIGLPGETTESHLNTLITAFDLGFGKIYTHNIRMLLGSQYESEKYRKKYGIKTKFRPIFGAYGIYDGQKVFEVEESVRATNDMTESELENFKILHWLINFLWNTGLFKPILRYFQWCGVNPGLVLYKLSSARNHLLASLFSKMNKESMAEWYETKEEMILFYQQQKNFEEMVNNFVKLNFLWIANVYQDPDIMSALLKEFLRISKIEIKSESREFQSNWEELVEIVSKLICNDFLQKDFSHKDRYTGKALSFVFNDSRLTKRETIEVEIYRDKQDFAFCNYHLNPGGKKNVTLQNLARFLEMGGMNKLINRIRLVSI
jgi:putative methyltransferase